MNVTGPKCFLPAAAVDNESLPGTQIWRKEGRSVAADSVGADRAGRFALQASCSRNIEASSLVLDLVIPDELLHEVVEYDLKLSRRNLRKRVDDNGPVALLVEGGIAQPSEIVKNRLESDLTGSAPAADLKV